MRLVFDEYFLSARKRAALGKDIFDETEAGDHLKAKQVLESRQRKKKLEPTSEGLPLASANPRSSRDAAG